MRSGVCGVTESFPHYFYKCELGHLCIKINVVPLWIRHFSIKA